MANQTIAVKANGNIIVSIAASIVQNKDLLSEIDGKIGDGDHGVNMAKGFGRAADRIDGKTSFSQALLILSSVLMGEIGGSMGPLYGVMFMGMADAIENLAEIDVEAFENMLVAAQEEIAEIGGAKVGDKTLMDVLIPAVEAYKQKRKTGGTFSDCLAAMVQAAEIGRDSTKDLTAKIGRAARLGERSKGVLDAGATSCCLILTGLANEMSAQL